MWLHFWYIFSLANFYSLGSRSSVHDKPCVVFREDSVSNISFRCHCLGIVTAQVWRLLALHDCLRTMELCMNRVCSWNFLECCFHCSVRRGLFGYFGFCEGVRDKVPNLFSGQLPYWVM